MSAEDLPAVAAIEAATFPNPWPLEALRFEFEENPFCSAFVIESSGQVAGYAYLWIVYDFAHLINIALSESCRGRGLGEALLRHLLEYAARNGAQKIHLEVRETNEAAIGLYLKHEFEVLGRGERYYSDGTAALFMEKTL
jgi:ribosomal-protein-alanine N-acetyltransferase